MADSVVNVAVETIGKMLIDEAIFLSGVSEQVEQLKTELNELQSFLKDADARQNDNEMIKVWVSQSRDLAYEAEDLVEDYAFKIESRKGNILKRSVCILNECAVRHSIGAEIRTLRSKIANLTRRFEGGGLARREEDGGSCSSSSVKQLRRTYSQIAEDDFVGMEKDVETLVAHLINETKTRHYRVASITGMGGLGKTTIARKVYNHPGVKRCFDAFAWVCVSQQPQKRDLLQAILIKFIPEKTKEIHKYWRDEQLVRELRDILKNKRYFIVLDDIWSIDAWDFIKEAFPIKEDSSAILVTTRDEGVAMQIGPTGFHHKPRLLNEQESWELLRIKAFRRGEGEQGPEDMHKMEELGKEMVVHCGGLPLAVVVLGGILVTKRDLNEWQSISKHVKAYLGRGKGSSQGEVKKILGLSYNELPLKLKPCFLYLGRYPEDSEIEAEKLYQLWIAEGMVSVKDQIGDESMMNTAESYLSELAQRSLVRVEVSEIPGVARFRSCRLHDLVRDLSLQKAKEENFFLFVHSQNGSFDNQVYNSSSSSTGQIHRLLIHFDEEVAQYLPPPKRLTRHLRSLKLLVQNWDGYVGCMPWAFKSQLNWFRMLRVLEFEGFDPNPDSYKESFCGILNHLKLPDAICNLIHLRYLSLRGSLFFWLPSSLGNLQHLHTIDLRGIHFWMPNVLGKLRQLRHLYLPGNWLKRKDFGNKLRLEGLNKLEILEGLDNQWCSTEDLLKLTNLRQLQARLNCGYGDVTEIASFISNLNMCHAKLVIYFPEDDSPIISENYSAAVTKLFSCRNLLQLKMLGRIGNVPKYEAGFASDLCSLTLHGSELQEDPMETLEMLPNLRYLSLWRCIRGTEMQCRAMGFPQLRTLELYDLLLVKWTIAEGSMPNLSSLTILMCKKLEMIPDELRSITALKELIIGGMPEEFNSRIQVIDGEEGEDFDKIRHVPLVKVI